MIIRKNELTFGVRESIRGGAGKALAANYLKENDQQSIRFVSVIELEPSASVGEHIHENDEEFYLVMKGSGTGILDGKQFEVVEGDAFVCKKNHTHGIKASKEGLTFLAVLSGS